MLLGHSTLQDEASPCVLMAAVYDTLGHPSSEPWMRNFELSIRDCTYHFKPHLFHYYVFAYVAEAEVGQRRGRGAVVSQVLMSFYVFTKKIIIDLIIS